MTRLGFVLGAQVLVVACCGVAAAATLEQDACAKLKTELLQLELAGTRTSMAKGPDWAKANLGTDKLQQIKRLLEVEEQILFRCQGKPLVVLPEGVDAEAAAVPADRGKEGTAAAKPAAEKPAAESKGAAKEPQSPPGKAKAAGPAGAKAAGAAATAPPGKSAGAAKAAPEPAATAAAPKPKPKPKPTPKVDDAYRPAPTQPADSPGASKP
jgi:hypothetical protein